MANVYSTRLWAASFGSGFPVSSAVPAGYVWVARDITITAGSAFPTVLNGMELFVGAATSWPIWNLAPPELHAGYSHHRTGWWVLNAGDTFQVNSHDSTGYSIVISGHQLTLP